MTRRLNRKHFAATLLGAASTVRPAAAQTAQFDFKHADDNPPGVPSSVRTLQMWDAVKRETNGRLTVTMYSNDALGSQTSTFSQLRVGAIQFLTGNSGVYAELVPSAAIDTIGFAFRSAAQATSALDGPLGAYIRREFAAKGLYAFEKIFDLGFRRIESAAKPIDSVGDLAGFKIRTSPSRIAVDLFRTLGASPTPLSGGEMYSGLQTHLLDGLEITLSGFEQLKLYEVAKYVSLTNHVWAGAWVIANGDAWNSLPPEIRNVVTRNAVKYTLLARQDAAAADGAAIARLKDRGIAFNAPDTASFRARLGPYYERWRPEIGTAAWSLLEAKVGKLG